MMERRAFLQAFVEVIGQVLQRQGRHGILLAQLVALRNHSATTRSGQGNAAAAHAANTAATAAVPSLSAA
jgi:hypothetical protein